jgi:hypothetical protein
MQDPAKTIANTIPRPANKESWTLQWDRYLPTEATLPLDLGSMQHARVQSWLNLLDRNKQRRRKLSCSGLIPLRHGGAVDVALGDVGVGRRIKPRSLRRSNSRRGLSSLGYSWLFSKRLLSKMVLLFTSPNLNSSMRSETLVLGLCHILSDGPLKDRLGGPSSSSIELYLLENSRPRPNLANTWPCGPSRAEWDNRRGRGLTYFGPER